MIHLLAKTLRLSKCLSDALHLITQSWLNCLEKLSFFGCWKSLSAASKWRKTRPCDHRISKFSGGACPRTPLGVKALRALPILCPGVKLSCPPVENLNEPPALLLNYDVKWPNFRCTWERRRQDESLYYLRLNSHVVPSLQPNFPFFKYFSGRIVSSILTATWRSLFNYRTLEGAYWADCVDDVDNDQTLQPAVVWYWYNLWIPLLPWLRPTQKETSQPVNYIKSQRHYYIITIIYLYK